jgi:hypothetical protein
MIRLCGIVDIDIFCATNRNFPCTLPALTTSFTNTCGPRYPWRNCHVSLKENTALRYVVSHFLEKYPRNFFLTIQVMGSVSCNQQPWKKTWPDPMSGRQNSKVFTFNTKAAVKVPRTLVLEVPKWYGYVVLLISTSFVLPTATFRAPFLL